MRLGIRFKIQKLKIGFSHLKMSVAPYENPDLKRERQNCPFDREEITNLIDGGVEETKERRELGINS